MSRIKGAKLFAALTTILYNSRIAAAMLDRAAIHAPGCRHRTVPGVCVEKAARPLVCG